MMLSNLWSLVEGLSPVDFKLLVIGCAVGLLSGPVFILWNQSVEYATAVGVMWCISATVGAFVGINVWRFILRGFDRWAGVLKDRAESSTGHESNPGTEPVQLSRKARWLMLILSSCIYASLFGLSGLAIQAIATTISLAVGLFNIGVFVPGMVVGFGAAFFGLTGLSVFFWYWNRQLCRLEKQPTVEVPATAMVPSFERLDQAFRRPRLIVHKMTGVKERFGEEITA